MTQPPADWRDLPYRTLTRVANLWAVQPQAVRRAIMRGTLPARKATPAEILTLIQLGEIHHIPRDGVWLVEYEDAKHRIIRPSGNPHIQELRHQTLARIAAGELSGTRRKGYRRRTRKKKQ